MATFFSALFGGGSKDTPPPPPKEDAAAKRQALERGRLRNLSGFRSTILGSAFANKTKLGQ